MIIQKKRKIFFIVAVSAILLSLVFGLISCKGEATQLNGDWNVMMINDENINASALIEGLPLVRFDTAQGMISGNSGCNSFTANAGYTGDTIEIGDITTTLIACENMEVEERFLEILNNQTVIFELAGDSLTITNDTGGKLTLVKSTIN